jgi:hypothetical protein
MDLIDSWQDSLDGGSARRKATAYIGQHKPEETQTYIHSSRWIQTHYLSVQTELDI